MSAQSVRTTSGFVPDMTFINYQVLLAYVTEWAKCSGFRHGCVPKSYFTTLNWPFDTPFRVKYPFRGWFICSPKSNSRTPGSICCWKLTYKWDTSRRLFIWLPDYCHLEHSHGISLPQYAFDGRTEVRLESDLKPSEAKFIQCQSLMRTDIPNMTVNIEREFPNRSFHHDLLRRVRCKALDDRYGSDRTQLGVLFKKGNDIRRHGGIFVIDPSTDDFSIKSLHFQPSLMRQYALTYGVDDLKMADGSHHLSQKNSIAIVWIVIDALLRTKFAGITYAFSEHHVDIVNGAQLFFPGDGVEKCSNTLALGEFPGFFDPFIDNEISSEGDNHDLPQASDYSTPIITDKNTAGDDILTRGSSTVVPLNAAIACQPCIGNPVPTTCETTPVSATIGTEQAKVTSRDDSITHVSATVPSPNASNVCQPCIDNPVPTTCADETTPVQANIGIERAKVPSNSSPKKNHL